jgi:hypothetical protein
VIYRDPKCVCVTADMGQAEVVADWLRQQGIGAQVMNQATLGGLLGLTPYAGAGVSSAGVEVWVEDPAQAEEAKRLLAEQMEQASARKKKAEADPTPVEVVCEDCGRATTYPGKDRGTVQNCGHCESYVDVPGDDDWEDPDEEADAAE